MSRDFLGRDDNLADKTPVISAAVMTHPARMSAARQVAHGLQPLSVQVAVDPEPNGPPSALRSAGLAFSLSAPTATHHLVVQDDVLIADGFVEAVGQCISLHPEAILSFFVEWGSRTANLARWAALTGCSAVPVINPYVPTVALAMPRALAAELAEFMRTDANGAEADDRAVRRFASLTGTSSLVMLPNLIEHGNLPSLTGNDAQGERRSVCFMPEEPWRANDSVLAVPRLLPFLAWTDGWSVMIDTHNDIRSTQRPTVEVLGEWGADRAQLWAAYRKAFSRRTALERLRVEAGDKYLFELWITAVAMGAIQKYSWPESIDALEAPVGDPIVTEALRTMAPGALRVFLKLDLLTNCFEDLAWLMLCAMQHGAERCNARLHEIPPAG